MKPEDRSGVLRAVIGDIDRLMLLAKLDLAELNDIALYLRQQKNSGKISELHYTVDKERIKRLMVKCKSLLLTLIQHRQRALSMLRE